MSFAFGIPRPRRRPSLTPMIDVVFLLLVFFMLVARFGQDGALPLSLPGTADSTAYSGPPRLVDIGPDGLRLNGITVDADALTYELTALTEASTDTIVLRAVEGASLQRLVTVMQALRDAGYTALVLVQ